MEKGFEEPTLIVAARQDMVVGYRDAWTILESYPRATFAVVDRADHGWPVGGRDLLGAPARRVERDGLQIRRLDRSAERRTSLNDRLLNVRSPSLRLAALGSGRDDVIGLNSASS